MHTKEWSKEEHAEKMMQLIMMLYSISWYQVSSTEQNIIFYARNKQVRSLICFQIKKRKKKRKTVI